MLDLLLTPPRATVAQDAILGDIIDYDELLTGKRSEAMYTMLETARRLSARTAAHAAVRGRKPASHLPLTCFAAPPPPLRVAVQNIQQGVELLLSVAQLFAALAGYEPIGGCECGCGVSCLVAGMPHARWICAGSVGYACDDDIAQELLFQPEPDIVPCAVQNDAVYWVTAVWFVFIPARRPAASSPQPAEEAHASRGPSATHTPRWPRVGPLRASRACSPSRRCAAPSSPRSSRRASRRASRPSRTTRRHASPYGS